jgi:hypothetical protein
MGMFKGLGQAKAQKGGNYFKDGQYEVEIQRVLARENKDGHDCFIVETKVVSSTNPEVPVGMECSQVVNLTKHGRSAAGNVKGFLAAALGIDDADNYQPENGQAVDQFWESQAEDAISEEQPLAGVRMTLNVRTAATKSGGKFTHHNWQEVTFAPQ